MLAETLVDCRALLASGGKDVPGGQALIDEILAKLKACQENLNILTWAIDNNLPMEEVLSILLALDINSRRIEFQLDTRLSQAN